MKIHIAIPNALCYYRGKEQTKKKGALKVLIAKITDSDFFGGEPQYIEDNARYNVRGVVINPNGDIAMMKIENSEYYKLLGGSVDITETPELAFLRQASEETGQQVEKIGYIGWIEEHKNKRKFCMVSHCYAVRTISDTVDTNQLAFSEERLGYKLEWISYEDAMTKLKELSKNCKEYQMNFILKREYLILESARSLIENAQEEKVQ